MLMQKSFLIALLTFTLLLGEEADHIIFTQITTSSDEAAQVVVIYNPTDEVTDLSNYYLSDAELALRSY